MRPFHAWPDHPGIVPGEHMRITGFCGACSLACLMIVAFAARRSAVYSTGAWSPMQRIASVSLHGEYQRDDVGREVRNASFSATRCYYCAGGLHLSLATHYNYTSPVLLPYDHLREVRNRGYLGRLCHHRANRVGFPDNP